MDTKLQSSAPASAEDPLAAVKEAKKQLETRVDTLHEAQVELISSLQTLVPDIVSSLDLSLHIISTFNQGRPFVPLPNPLPVPNSGPSKAPPIRKSEPSILNQQKKLKSSPPPAVNEGVGGGGGVAPLSVVRSMVAVCLLEIVPFMRIDSSSVLRKLQEDNDQSAATAVERAALRELGGGGGETGGILAVEMALRSMAADNGGVELEEFVVNGKSRVMVVSIDRTKLVKELPESKQLYQQSNSDLKSRNIGPPASNSNANLGGGGAGGFRPMRPEMWGTSPGMFARGMPRGMPPPSPGSGIMGMMPRGVGVPPPMQRPPTPMNMVVGPTSAMKPPSRSEEDDMKDIEALLNTKSFREQQKSKAGEELLDLIHRPTAKETAVAAKFKSKGGSQVKEYCTALTKEDCRRQSGSYIACQKVHFRRIIAPHTDVILGDCSFLDTCRHMKTCKYVHYELDSTPDMSALGALTPPKPLKPQRDVHYCSEVELGESQWINCDIRNFRMDILGHYGVIMADPPWDIHMELPYGTMADDEMRTLNVPALQTDGLIFLWVTGRAMELGRECLELWGYKRVEEIIWVKTNQLQRIIRTGRTGHWLNHSKEHCLVGIKGNPEVNRNIDTDVVVAEVRETSRKPDEVNIHLCLHPCNKASIQIKSFSSFFFPMLNQA
ncbi:OLC1v1028889C1 [Oldenlandia corymbosa var. corymbosa]|uniref:OLC1v1028889C1 n=1 Tax=Oldenlandia corymbosa var. corymbosa TaxID=529605 RepID=A0AAV1CCY8_OLDCO|nr:OLC1v1028889C1 [Oldenlandia corymbosa var. corymbosa]